MSNLTIESSDQPLSEQSTNKLSISPQLYQHIHGLITRRKEEHKKDYSTAIALEIKDIQQLDFKIRQILEQYEVLAATSSFTAYYHNDEKKNHSSIDSFIYTATTSNNVTQSVVIEYSISIMLPAIKQPQNFTIDITVTNRMAAVKKILLEAGLASKYLHIFTRDTVELRIEYIDYAICRNFSTAIDEWVNSLTCIEQNKIISFAKKHSDLIVPTSINITMAAIFLGLFTYLPNQISSASIPAIIKYLVSCSATLFGGYALSRAIGRWIDKKLGQHYEMSYLRISRGDEKEISLAAAKNKNEIIKSIIGGVASGAAATALKFLVSMFNFS